MPGAAGGKDARNQLQAKIAVMKKEAEDLSHAIEGLFINTRSDGSKLEVLFETQKKTSSSITTLIDANKKMVEELTRMNYQGKEQFAEIIELSSNLPIRWKKDDNIKDFVARNLAEIDSQKSELEADLTRTRSNLATNKSIVQKITKLSRNRVTALELEEKHIKKQEGTEMRDVIVAELTKNRTQLDSLFEKQNKIQPKIDMLKESKKKTFSDISELKAKRTKKYDEMNVVRDELDVLFTEWKKKMAAADKELDKIAPYDQSIASCKILVKYLTQEKKALTPKKPKAKAAESGGDDDDAVEVVEEPVAVIEEPKQLVHDLEIIKHFENISLSAPVNFADIETSKSSVGARLSKFQDFNEKIMKLRKEKVTDVVPEAVAPAEDSKTPDDQTED